MTLINPYLIEIITDVKSNKSVNKKIHLELGKSIALDYKKYKIEKESIYIDGQIVEDIKNNNIFLLNSQIKVDKVRVETDFQQRKNILSQVTCRYLISSALDKYLGLKVSDFHTYKDYSSFFIENIYFDNQALEIISILEELVQVYIDFGMDISSKIETNQSIIDGIYQGPILGPHLNNTSEIKFFHIKSFSFNEKGLTVNYKTY